MTSSQLTFTNSHFSRCFFLTTKQYIYIAIGSMVLVYMLTWLGYIDGIRGTPYIAAPWIRHGIGEFTQFIPVGEPKKVTYTKWGKSSLLIRLVYTMLYPIYTSKWGNRATLLSLFACRIALVVALLEFWDRSRSPLVTLGLSDRSRCGAVPILRWIAQPSCLFRPVRSLSLCRSANSEIPRAIFSAVWACNIVRVVQRCSFWWPRRSCAEILTRMSFMGSLRRGLYRELFWRSCADSSYRDLVQRFCQESLTEILPTELF